MTKNEAQKVLQIMRPLDQFTGSSNTLNTHRSWHATWVQLYEQCAQQVAAMVEKPVEPVKGKKQDKPKGTVTPPQGAS